MSMFSRAQGSGRNPQETLAFILYCFVIFFLASGRITFWITEEIDIKIGENPENLLPLLIVAWILSGGLDERGRFVPLQSLATGLFLILAGVVAALALHPSEETAEDILRLLGQAGCGVFLAGWLSDRRGGETIKLIVFYSGLTWMMLWTPWGALENPNLEASFPHRNLQAAFLILAFPLVFRAFDEDAKKVPSFVRVWVVFLLISGALFLVLSRTRSGILGVSAGILFFILSAIRRQGLAGRSVKWSIAVLLAAIVGVATLAPRFSRMGEELGDLYRRSRSGIWAAAVEGWRDPEPILFGIGMGDSFDRILIDSPTGNLNHRYRKAHYPHGLYFQWLYWGGVTSLLGWMWVLFKTFSRGTGERVSLSIVIAVSAVFGYACLELFESAFRDPRVATLFWLVISIIHLEHIKPEPASARSTGD